MSTSGQAARKTGRGKSSATSGKPRTPTPVGGRKRTVDPAPPSGFRLHPAMAWGAGVLVVFGILRMLTIDSPRMLGAALSDAITLAAGIVVESLPFVLLGIAVSILVQLFVPSRIIMKILPRNGIARRAVLSLFGVVFPVCECGNVPLARGLMLKGLSVPDAMTFLIAAPIINPITIITTYQAFGWSDGILAARILGGFLIANLVGLVLSRHRNPDDMLTPKFAASCRHDHAPTGGKASQAVEMFGRESAAMLPALFIGASLAGAIQVVVSRDLLKGLGGHWLWGILVMMLLAFIISICANVDAFFALSLAALFSPGALVAFLVFGPMIDVKMVAMMRTTFRGSTVLRTAAVCAIGTFILAIGVNLLG